MRYSIIYADPPWKYKVWSEKATRTADSHYDIMSIDEIKSLDVQSIADENSALFLWATAPCMPQAFEVIEAWGFTFKTVAFVWVKRNKVSDSYFFGLGHWTRANAEFVLLGTRGSPKRVSKKVFSVCDDRIMEHSKKPDTIRHRIVELMGDVPRIELFARDKPIGWDAWGNEVEGGIEWK